MATAQPQEIPEIIAKDLKCFDIYLKSFNEAQEPWKDVGVLYTISQVYPRYEAHARAALRDLMIKHNIFDVVVKIWDHCHSTDNADENYLVASSYIKMKQVCLLLSDDVNFCKEAFRHKLVFERFMREFTLPELRVKELDDATKRQRIGYTLRFLQNALRIHNPIRELVRQNDGVQRLLSFYDSQQLIIKSRIMLVLAYCVNEEENDKVFADYAVPVFHLGKCDRTFEQQKAVRSLLVELLLAGKTVIESVVMILKRSLKNPDHVSDSFASSEIVDGLNKLAINDRNKISIVEKGVLPHLLDMLTNDKFPDEYAPAAECLWSLSFLPWNKECIQTEPDLMDAVQRLLNDPKSDEATRKACEGIIFNLEGKNSSDSPPSASTAGDTKKQHIMISYQWDVQPIILKVRDQLKDNGFNVWLDVDNMKGSILSAMADAVENASVLVVGVTERYKNSNACRTEAEYAYKLSKPIAPLLLEPHYKADGWLGALLGMELYIDVSSEDVLNAKVDQIVEMIRLKAAGQKVESKIVKKTASLSTVPSITVVDGPARSKSFSKLSTNDVKKWAEKTGIDGLPNLLAAFDGLDLEQLNRLLQRSPDIYYNFLRVELKLSMLQTLRFTRFLEEL